MLAIETEYSHADILQFLLNSTGLDIGGVAEEMREAIRTVQNQKNMKKMAYAHQGRIWDKEIQLKPQK